MIFKIGSCEDGDGYTKTSAFYFAVPDKLMDKLGINNSHEIRKDFVFEKAYEYYHPCHSLYLKWADMDDSYLENATNVDVYVDEGESE